MSAALKKKLHQQWGAWVWIKWKSGAPEDACATWKHLKEIKEAWSMTGQWDCALWVELSDPKEVEKLVWRELRSNKWVEKTETHWAKKYW